MGIPEMQELWLDLQEKYRSGNIKKKEEQLYKKWGKALKLLSADPGYPSLQTHEIEPLSRRYGMKVWQSYLEIYFPIGIYYLCTCHYYHKQDMQVLINLHINQNIQMI